MMRKTLSMSAPSSVLVLFSKPTKLWPATDIVILYHNYFHLPFCIFQQASGVFEYFLL